jgi:hypothetical protein
MPRVASLAGSIVTTTTRAPPRAGPRPTPAETVVSDAAGAAADHHPQVLDAPDHAPVGETAGQGREHPDRVEVEAPHQLGQPRAPQAGALGQAPPVRLVGALVVQAPQRRSAARDEAVGCGDRRQGWRLVVAKRSALPLSTAAATACRARAGRRSPRSPRTRRALAGDDGHPGRRGWTTSWIRAAWRAGPPPAMA